MAVRLIATDMDNTLLAPDKSLSRRNLNALKDAIAHGTLVVLSSGRMPQSVVKYAREIGVNAPVICYNGALTYDLDRQAVVAEALMPQETARALCRTAESMGQYVQAFWDQKFFYQTYTEKSALYEKKADVIGQATGKKLSLSIPMGVYKILIIVEPGDIPKYLPVLRAAHGDEVDFQPSSSTFIECVYKGVNKGSALRALAASRSIAPSEILAFGDELNDLSMLQQVGYGYAMANAAEAIRRQVKFVAPAFTEDGVAQVIERYIAEGALAGPREG